MPSKIRMAMSMVSSGSLGGSAGSGAEASAVGGRRDADATREGAAQGLDGAEAGGGGDLLDRGGAGLEAGQGRLDADLLDVGRWRGADLAGEGAGEVAHAHRGAGGQRRHGQVGGRVVGDPGLEVAQRLALGLLGGELGAELG